MVREVESETGTRFSRGVRASIVRRHHLDVERAIATVDVVLDPDVWELHVPLIVAWQLVLQGPGANLFKLAIWPAVRHCRPGRDFALGGTPDTRP